MSNKTAIELMDASLEQVWNERDDARRDAALEKIYHPQAVLYEPENTAEGRQAISERVAAVLSDMPPGFAFEPVGSSIGHNGVSAARWQGTADGKVLLTGIDVARANDGLISELYVFLDPQD